MRINLKKKKKKRKRKKNGTKKTTKTTDYDRPPTLPSDQTRHVAPVYHAPQPIQSSLFRHPLTLHPIHHVILRGHQEHRLRLTAAPVQGMDLPLQGTTQPYHVRPTGVNFSRLHPPVRPRRRRRFLIGLRGVRRLLRLLFLLRGFLIGLLYGRPLHRLLFLLLGLSI